MPGLGFIAFGERAEKVIPSVNQPRYYFDALDYLKNIPRGMTPFTPALYAILQVQRQTKTIRTIGIEKFVERHQRLAKAFRQEMSKSKNIELFPQRPSNAISVIRLPKSLPNATLIPYLAKEYNWAFAPNAIKSEDRDLFRISHMGDLSEQLMVEIAQGIVKAIEKLS